MLTPAHFVQVSSELRAGFPNLRLHSRTSMIRIFLSFVITVVCFSMYRWLLIEAWFSQKENGCPLAHTELSCEVSFEPRSSRPSEQNIHSLSSHLAATLHEKLAALLRFR